MVLKMAERVKGEKEKINKGITCWSFLVLSAIGLILNCNCLKDQNEADLCYPVHSLSFHSGSCAPASSGNWRCLLCSSRLRDMPKHR
jgi:hypothetical protein